MSPWTTETDAWAAMIPARVGRVASQCSRDDRVGLLGSRHSTAWIRKMRGAGLHVPRFQGTGSSTYTERAEGTTDITWPLFYFTCALCASTTATSTTNTPLFLTHFPPPIVLLSCCWSPQESTNVSCRYLSSVCFNPIAHGKHTVQKRKCGRHSTAGFVFRRPVYS